MRVNLVWIIALSVLRLCAETDFYDTGCRLFSEKKYQEAIFYFEQELTKNPQDFATLNYLGAAYRELGNPADAEDCFCNALKVKPEYAYSLINLAVLYVDTQEDEKLWLTGEKLVKYYPDRFYGYLVAAYFWYRKEAWTRAKDSIQAADSRFTRNDSLLGKKESDYLRLMLLELKKKINQRVH